MPLAQVAYVDFVVGRCTVCLAKARRIYRSAFMHSECDFMHVMLSVHSRLHACLGQAGVYYRLIPYFLLAGTCAVCIF